MTDNAHKPIYPTGRSHSGTGLTKREYFAALAMQGMLANVQTVPNKQGIEYSAEIAVIAADALLKELQDQYFEHEKS